VAVLDETNRALEKAKQINTINDSLHANYQMQLTIVDTKNEMLEEDIEKLKKESKLWKWIAAGAAVLGFVLGAR